MTSFLGITTMSNVQRDWSALDKADPKGFKGMHVSETFARFNSSNNHCATGVPVVSVDAFRMYLCHTFMAVNLGGPEQRTKDELLDDQDDSEEDDCCD